ncbi:MAG: uncharacterized protein KVP18_000733 [Porospora cf. gigantea A]|uniref:uncharacterized protein n=1 Tax=Porospora cf. gigantea A TaxID=2853593 RepID=UPI00355A6DAE|nr:MAG: hypothetical protein KVP18_000733 [Porospora cf. gigantea A]
MNVEVTHSDMPGRTFAVQRLQDAMTVADLKEKLYLVTGTPVASQQLYVKDRKSGAVLEQLADQTVLGSLAALLEGDGVLHVVDVDPNGVMKQVNAQLAEGFAPYRMPDTEYEKRPNTMRQFLSNIRRSPEMEQRRAALRADLEAVRERLPLNSRCRTSGDRRGLVSYVGVVDGTVKVGITLDEPLGSGSQGLFVPADEKRAVVCLAADVEGGAFPPLDFEDEM